MTRNRYYLGKYQTMYSNHCTNDIPEPDFGGGDSTSSSGNGCCSAVAH